MTFGELRSELDDLAGLDLETGERDRLLNEGHRELACKADWYRATIDLGPTVTDQAAYTLPADVYRIIRLGVNGSPFDLASAEDIERLSIGELQLRGDGVYELSFSATNDEQVTIYPTPSTDGYSISALVVERPALMDDDADEPVVPPEYHRAIVDYARGIAIASGEDVPDERAIYMQSFDRAVESLRRLRNSKGRRGVSQVRVVGIHV